MKAYDFENSAGYWLILAARSYQKALEVEFAPFQLTYRQAQVLGWLVLDGELSQVELADRMMIEPATLVGVLDRMERDRLIERTLAPNDRRKKVIRLNDAADTVWSDVIVCAKRVRAKATRGLSDRQLASLFKALQTIKQNLEIDELQE